MLRKLFWLYFLLVILGYNNTAFAVDPYCISGYTYNSETNKCEADPLCPEGWYDGSSFSSPLCVANATFTCSSTAYTLDMELFMCLTAPVCCGGATLVNANNSVYCDEGHPQPCHCEGYGGMGGVCQHAVDCPDGGGLYYFTYTPAYAECHIGMNPASCPSGYVYWVPQRICEATPQCPNGGSFVSSRDICQATPITDEANHCGLGVGKPVNVASGTVYTSITDFSIKGIMPVDFIRYYNSKGTLLRGFGYQWSHSFDTRVMSLLNNLYEIINPDGSVYYYNDTNGDMVYEADIPKGITDRLIKNQNGTFTREYKDGSTEEFKASGYLKAIVDRNGNRITITRDTSNHITKITTPEGREILVSAPYGKINSITLPDGKIITYTYLSSSGYLEKVTHHDNSWRKHYYVNISGVGFRLSGIKSGKDSETGKYIEKHTYDLTTGKAITSSVDGTKELLTIGYIDDSQSTVTDSLGRITTYNFGRSGGKNYPTSVTGPGCRSCGQSDTSMTYDDALNVTSITDANGNVTMMTYEGNDMVTKIEAYGTEDERTTAYSYNEFAQVLTETYDDGTITKFTYDDYGNITEKKEAYGTSDESTMIYTYYGAENYWQLHTVSDSDGNLTEFTYTCNSDGHTKTEIKYLQNTTLTTIYVYDVIGNLESVTDANGNATTYEYDLRDRLKREIRPDGGEINYEYDPAGNRTAVVDANTNRTEFTYNAANWLTKITDHGENTTNYTYDTEGNMSSATIKDTADNIKMSGTYTYDDHNRLIRTTHLDTTYTEQTYDEVGNVLTKRDENGNVTTFTHDALNRLKTVTDANEGVTSYTYDSRNNLALMTDANGNVTTYTYNSLNRLISTTSPDTGTTTYIYDADGNMITKTDADNVTTSYAYDALNRQISAQFPDPAQNIEYYYDDAQAQNGKGRLTSMTDQSGTTGYDYDTMGRVLTETKQINNLNYRTEYTYDLNGNVLTMTYPGGRQITYTYNQQNKVTSVADTYLGTTRTLASNISYEPFGDMSLLTYGNTLQRTIGHDNRYRINSITTGNIQNLSFAYLDNGNVSGITNNFDALKNRTYTYDALSRLTLATGPWGAAGYTYDNVGNRAYETTDSGNTTYGYDPNTNKLTSAAGEKAFSFSYDNNGNTTDENNRQYIYNYDQRLTRVTENGITNSEYVFNGKGQRVKKWVSNGNQCTVFHYDQNGLLIAESTSTGTITAEYVYLNGQPLAKIENNNIYYYHNDHLGSPMMMTDSTGSVVWQGEFKPFGEPVSVSGSVINNLRFPGQYFDSETGLNQNWHRDYRPETGTYIETDPILQPMINSTSELKMKPIYSSCSKSTSNLSWHVPLLLSNSQDLHPYAYTADNPVNHTDPQGLTANKKVYVNCTRLTCNWPVETPINICVYSCEYCYEIDCHGEKVNFKDNCVKMAMGNPGVI